MNFADIKFNNGQGALLCNRCGEILATGFDHEDKLHFCEKCETKLVEEAEKEK